MGVLSDLTTLCLEVNDFENVHRWADALLASEPDYLWYGQRPGYDYIAARSGKACHTAYYSKAFAFQKQGDLNAAIQKFTNASLCDSSCHATYYQLEALKLSEDRKEMVQETNEKKLQPEWDVMDA